MGFEEGWKPRFTHDTKQVQKECMQTLDKSWEHMTLDKSLEHVYVEFLLEHLVFVANIML